MRRSWLRAVFGNLLVLAVAVGFSLLLGEIVVRAAMPQQLIQIRPDIWQPADTLGWRMRPGVRTTINTGEGTVPVRTDHEGLRVGERGRIEADPCLLIVGDSYTEAFQVAYEQSFAGLLERDLPATVGAPVAVRVLAAGGWDPCHYLLAARAYLRNQPCPLVLVPVYVGNDLLAERVDAYRPREPLPRHRLRIPRAMTRREWVRALLLPVNDALETRWHLYILVRTRLWGLRVRLGLGSTAGIPFQFLRREASSPVWAVTADVLHDLDAAARAAGSRALFALIPTTYQVDPAVFERWRRASRMDTSEVDLEQPTRRLGRELAARGLDVIDALPAFRAAAARGGPPLFGAVDAHLSPAGHREFTRLLAPAAANRLRRPAAAPTPLPAPAPGRVASAAGAAP